MAENFPFFITDDGNVFQNTTNGGRFIRPEKIREAMAAKDSRPADEDVVGNWGPVKFGTQASVRFAKSNYSGNETITATFIIRDVGDQDSSFSFRPSEPVTCIRIVGPQGTILHRTDVPKPKDPRMAAAMRGNAKAAEYWLLPGMQRKFEADLRAHFDLSEPGRYVIYARPRVLNPATGKYEEIDSGKATITISEDLFRGLDRKAKHYPYFITDDGFVYLEATNSDGSRVIRPEKIEEAKKAKESRPADQDPEGNWGQPTNGLQTSIRFEKSAFATNDPIVANIILRNVGKDSRFWVTLHGLASDVLLTNPKGLSLIRKDWKDTNTFEGRLQRIVMNPLTMTIDPGMQRSFRIDLSGSFKMDVPGSYKIQADLTAINQTNGRMDHIRSAEVAIFVGGTDAVAPK